MPGRIDAIVVDVDGTLYRPAPVRREMSLRLAAFAVRRPADGWRTLRILRAYRQAQEQLRTAGSENGPARQLELAAAAAGIPKEWAEAAVLRWMESEPLDAIRRARYPGVEEFCAWAAGRGIALAALSDYPAAAKLQALDLARYFRVWASAQDPEIGCFKPDPAGLLCVLRALGVPPDRAVYIGDRANVDGALALSAGVQGFLLCAARRAPPGLAAAPNWRELLQLVRARVCEK